MSKNKILILFSSIGIVTLVLVIAGTQFAKTEQEKRNGLTEIFAVSVHQDIAYVTYNEGTPELYIKQSDQEELALQLDPEQSILDLAFSPDGSTLVYSVTDEKLEETATSTVYTLNMQSYKKNELFKKAALITEVAFDPKEAANLFYLQANTFEAYSPIASARPHDLDIFQFKIDDNNHTQYTNFSAYDMQSLQISPQKDDLYIQMTEEQEDMSADDIFEAKQRIFAITERIPEEPTIVSDPARDIDIYDFTLVPNEPAIIFQSISNSQSGETFEYELYYFNWETKKETQITNLKKYATKPTIAPEGNEVYFMVNHNFAGNDTDYRLYKMNLDGNNITEIKLQHAHN